MSCVCVHCDRAVDHVYTTYKTKTNIRLEVCPGCSLFVDPLIEHPPALVLIDLLLLKPRAYRHLLFNRGREPRRALAPVVPSGSGTDGSIGMEETGPDRAKYVRDEILRWGSVSILVDTVVRLAQRSNKRDVIGLRKSSVAAADSHSLAHSSSMRNDAFGSVSMEDAWITLGTLALVTLETVVQHVITLLAIRLFLLIRGRRNRFELDSSMASSNIDSTRYGATSLGTGRGERNDNIDGLLDEVAAVGSRAGTEDLDEPSGSSIEEEAKFEISKVSGTRVEFSLAHVSLALIYASILPLSLHLITSIWSAPSVTEGWPSTCSTPSETSPSVLFPLFPSTLSDLRLHIDRWTSTHAGARATALAWLAEADSVREMMRRDGMDGVWIAVHLLEGMSSGGALRVLLPTRPWETSMIVLAGLIARTAVTLVWQEGWRSATNA